MIEFVTTPVNNDWMNWSVEVYKIEGPENHIGPLLALGQLRAVFGMPARSSVADIKGNMTLLDNGLILVHGDQHYIVSIRRCFREL